MPLVSQDIDHFLNGISQQPKLRRLASQGVRQTNALDSISDGKMKRPPMKHVAKLSSDAFDQAAFVHPVIKNTGDKYRVVVMNGDLKVFDAETGDEINVVFPDGKTYLSADTVTTTTNTETFLGDAGTHLDGRSDISPFIWDRVYISSGTTDPVTIENNVLEQTNGMSIAASWSTGISLDAAEFTVSLKCRQVSDVGAATTTKLRIYFHMDASGNGYYLEYTLSQAGPTGQLGLYECSTWNPAISGTQLGISSATSIDTLAEYQDIELVVTNASFSGKLNGVEIVTGTDSTRTSGLVGLGLQAANTLNRRWLVNDFAIVYDETEAASPGSYRATTIGDTTILVNRAKTVARGNAVEAARSPEALVFIRQADYGTTYKLTVDGGVATYNTAEGVTPQSRDRINTDTIAGELKTTLDNHPGLSGFTVDRYGSTLHIYRADGQDFSIDAKDGLADGGIIVIKGSVQRFEDLPANAVDGFVVEITGDPGSQADNYYVVYDDSDTPGEAGVWRETVKPGLLTELDADTLPHTLVRNGGIEPDDIAAGASYVPVDTPLFGAEVSDSWVLDSFPSFGLGHLDDNEQTSKAVSGSNGIATTYRVKFKFNSEGVNPSLESRVSLCTHETPNDNLTALVYQQTILYGAGLNVTDQFLEAELALNDGDYITVRLDFPTEGTDEPDVWVQELSFEPITGTELDFGATRIYAAGTKYTATVDGNAAVYTVGSADETGATVATGLAAAIDALTDITGTASNGVISIVGASAVPVVSLVSDFSTATKVHLLDSAFTPDGLIDETVVNLNDGSTGTITDNTATTITVSSLTGGVNNTFAKGDKIRVVQGAAGDYFVFGHAPWRGREVGDDDTNPMPSILNQKIKDVFFHRNRLGMIAGQNVVLSASDDLFNLFRITATDLRDDDAIDVVTTDASSSDFHTAVSWNGAALLLSDVAQFAVSGEPMLAPSTIALPLLSSYENSPSVRPVVAGRSMFFASEQDSGYAQLFEYRASQDGETAQAIPLTKHVARLAKGKPFLLAASAEEGLVFLVTDDDRSKVYVYAFHDGNEGRELSSWSEWSLPATSKILSLDILDGHLGIVATHSGGVFYSTIDLKARFEADDTDLIHLDRRLDTLAGVFSTDTTFTLPFAVATDGSEGTVKVYRTDTGAELTPTRPTSTTAVVAALDLSAVDCIVGIQYNFLYEPTTLYFRPQGKILTGARLQIRYIDFHMSESESLTATVSAQGRTDRTYAYNSTKDALHVPVMCQNEQATLVLTNDTAKPCRILGATWEGFYNLRNRRQ